MDCLELEQVGSTVHCEGQYKLHYVSLECLPYKNQQLQVCAPYSASRHQWQEWGLENVKRSLWIGDPASYGACGEAQGSPFIHVCAIKSLQPHEQISSPDQALKPCPLPCVGFRRP